MPASGPHAHRHRAVRYRLLHRALQTHAGAQTSRVRALPRGPMHTGIVSSNIGMLHVCHAPAHAGPSTLA
eukprot:15437170-Alexandrium_andersonii.AAC.1